MLRAASPARRDAASDRPAAAAASRIRIPAVTAKEKLLERVPDMTEAQATAALRVVDAQERLTAYFEEEARLSDDEIAARDDRWAESNARDAIREEPW